MIPIYDSPLLPGWSEYPLKEITTRKRGYSWAKEQETNAPEIGAVPVIRIPNIGEVLDRSDLLYIREVSRDSLEQASVSKNWILFVGSNGNPERIGDSVLIEEDEEMVFASFLMGITSIDSSILLPEFLALWMRQHKVHQTFSKTSQQTTGLANFSWSASKKLPVRFPININEQREIVSAIRSVDEAIARTRDEISATQQLKKSLMQQLFTRGIPGRHKAFKQTKIGEIPEEWEFVRLSTLVEDKIANGYSPVCPQDPTGYWILTLSALGFESFMPQAIKPAPNYDPKVALYILNPGDLLVSRSNTPDRVGLAGLYRGEPQNCSYPDLMMRFRVNQSRVKPEFMEDYLRTDFARRWLTARASGTSGSMVKIKRRDLQSLWVALPEPDEQTEIISALEAAKSSIRAIEEYCLSLEKVKRSLLQNLLTGKIRVNLEATA